MKKRCYIEVRMLSGGVAMVDADTIVAIYPGGDDTITIVDRAIGSTMYLKEPTADVIARTRRALSHAGQDVAT